LDGKEVSLLIEGGKFDTIKLVVRHAERPIFKGAKAPHGVSLTDRGKVQAEQLGRVLTEQGIRIDGCASSHVPRCVQTAELIARGNQYAGPLEQSASLGGSDLFVIDNAALDHTLDTYTINDIIADQLAGRNVPGMLDLLSGMRIFLGRVLADRSKRFEVFVSHDLFVCPAVHYLTRTKFSPEGYTGFLEGFFIAFQDGKSSVLWNGQWHDVTDQLWELMA
jgi:hypothetical protein